ncbi:MAG: hypothetical protein RBR52_03125 [Thiomonas sp.]|uniref:hypothetical protein n=1 Tax=Thiomonas sp. TaxID=2047785 RepID=UPI002A36950F|nr:hypothetical protein [Thiomonas sp.]MDY0329472.1 hypothetical protein [Thiomonas sp.]
MRMQPKTLIAALALALPAAAFAAQPLAVRFDGRDMPMHETVEVVHTAAGPMQVKTWTWQSPQGHASVVIQQSQGGAMPAWAVQQMQALQAQFAQAQQIMARMNAQMQSAFGPLYTVPVLLPQAPCIVQQVTPVRVRVAPARTIEAHQQTPRPSTPAIPPAPRLQV